MAKPARVLPIVFSTELVQRIQKRRKTVTRRVVVPQPWLLKGVDGPVLRLSKRNGETWIEAPPGADVFVPASPFGSPGTILYVRESWQPWKGHQLYRADYAPSADGFFGPWRSGRFMPKRVARLFLIVRDVRLERLGDITEEDAKREGVKRGRCTHPDCYPGSCAASSWTAAFAMTWDRLHGQRDPAFTWIANPWVWRIRFTVPGPDRQARLRRELL